MIYITKYGKISYLVAADSDEELNLIKSTTRSGGSDMVSLLEGNRNYHLMVSQTGLLAMEANPHVGNVRFLEPDEFDALLDARLTA